MSDTNLIEEIELPDNGNGDGNELERVGAALKVFIDAQSGNLDVELGYTEGIKEALTGSGSAQPVPFISEEDGSSLTFTFNGTGGYIDVRPYTEATVAADAAVNGGADSTTVDVEGYITRSAATETLNSKTIAPADGQVAVLRSQDITDLSWLRVTEDSAGSDHSFFMSLK